MQQYKSLINYTLFGLCMTFAVVCSAVGFGDIKLYSYLNEPLSAELEILNLNGISPNQLIVNLASDKDFTRAGIARPYFLTNLQFQIVGYEGKVYIYISSSKVVTTPYLEFLIELSWPDGSLIKDYTLLVNPPPKNLTAATRPVPLSQIAAKEFANAEFGVKQQPSATEKPKYKPEQTSFSDESEFIQEQAEAAAKLKPVVTDANADAKKSGEVAQPEIAQNKINYEKRLQELKQQEEARLAEKAQARKEGNLGKVIDVLKDAQEAIEPTTDVAKLSNIRNKNTDMFKDAEEGASGEDIDFGDVIKPSSATTTAAAAPSAPTAPTVPAIPSAPLPPEQNMGIMLLLIGFALGLTGAAAFVFKKGYHRKIFAAKNQPVVDEESAEGEVNLNLDEDIDTPQQPETENIDAIDLNDFEDELDKLDLDNIMGQDKQARSLTEMFNVTQNVTQPAMPNITPLPKTSIADLTPEEEAINLKINLAKQYLEAQDKESAKAILIEVIATAKDAQKLEAEILLSGIV